MFSKLIQKGVVGKQNHEQPPLSLLLLNQYEPGPLSPLLISQYKPPPLSPLLLSNHGPPALSPLLVSNHEVAPLSPLLLSHHEPPPLSPLPLSHHKPPPLLALSKPASIAPPPLLQVSHLSLSSKCPGSQNSTSSAPNLTNLTCRRGLLCTSLLETRQPHGRRKLTSSPGPKPYSVQGA